MAAKRAVPHPNCSQYRQVCQDAIHTGNFAFLKEMVDVLEEVIRIINKTGVRKAIMQTEKQGTPTRPAQTRTTTP